MSSIKKNMLWSSILTSANYIFPLIVYPYISRVLGVTYLGTCNFVDSIINYYSLFAMMGITTLAIREISATKNNQHVLSNTFSSLLTLNMITTIIAIIALMVSIFIVPQFYENKELMFVGVVKLFFNTLLIEWFYRGIEDFKFITERTLVIKILYIISIFVFVKEPSDYIVYCWLTAFISVLNGIVNIIYSRRFVSFSFKDLHIILYIKPFFTLGIYALLISMYTTFNTAYLGFVGDNEQVGYYTTATKMHSILLSFFTAYTGVMLPRMSSLLAHNKTEDFISYSQKSIDFIFSFSIPLICLCITFADQIIRWISGPGYELAVPCMQIIMPLIFIIGYDQIITIQILLPLKRDKDVLVISLIGAAVGIVTNLIIVSRFLSIGSSFVWLISEIVVLCFAQYFATKQTGIIFPFKKLFKYIFAAIPLIIILMILHYFNPLGLYTVFIATFFTLIYFTIVEVYLFKNILLVTLYKQILQKISH